MTVPAVPDDELTAELDSQRVALHLIAALLIVGAAFLLAGLIVPLVLAIVLAIALSPVADRLERWGLGRTLASLVCLGIVTTVLAIAAGLFVYQASRLVRDSDDYLKQLSGLLARVSEWTGGSPLIRSAEGDKTKDATSDRSTHDGQPPTPGDRDQTTTDHDRDPAEGATGDWDAFVRQNAQAILRWLTAGLGGILGFLGGLVVFLAYLFYLLNTRSAWIERLRRTVGPLGLQPRRHYLERVRHEIVTFVGYLSLVSFCYAVVVSIVLSLIGVPEAILWGLLAGLLEVVPFFGPIISSILPTLVALSLGTWWQPLATAGFFLGLHTVEGYVVTPMVYGKAVKIDPVSVLFGVLFFGWIWGPLGLATAMPMLILLRGLVSITPGTPALDALADLKHKEPQEMGVEG
jgi:predicted PurR-regulated permease PerM